MRSITSTEGCPRVRWLDISPAGRPESECRGILSEDEIRRADMLGNERLYGRFIRARAGIRITLAEETGLDPASIRFEYSRLGKPELAPALNEMGIRFNLSRSGDLAVMAVGHGPVGVDLEPIGRRVPGRDSIVERFFAPEERAEYAAIPSSMRQEVFIALWVRKEAFVKAVDIGVARGLSLFAVSTDPASPGRLLRIPPELGPIERWTLEDIAAPDGFRASVVYSEDLRAET